MADPKLRYNITLVAAALVCVALWVAPSLATSPEPQLSGAVIEQNARLRLYLTSLKVREYLTSNKRLPESLDIPGVDSIGIEYSRDRRAQFELSMRVHGSRLVYRSTMPDSMFLGESLQIRGIN